MIQFLGFEWLAWLFGSVSAYWLIPGRYRNIFLVAITAIFVFVYSLESFIIITVFGLVLYFFLNQEKISGRRLILVLILIVSILFFYKIRLAVAPDHWIESVAVPLGLSYYSFRCMHYAFERYRNSIPQPAPQPFVSYLFFLPTFVVGPIHRAPAFFRDFQEKRFRAADFSEGLERILYGYVKIAFLGNYLISNQFQSFISGIDPVNEGLIEYLRMVRTALNLYVQFSGFSDIAIGYALLLGYRVIENFNFPYLSPNIAEFWKRWHISLTSWSRDYIYMPFLGLTRNPYVATCASFLVIGLWHEMSLRYVVWGLYHAAGVLFFQWLQRAKRRWKWFPKPKNPHARRLIHVFNVVLTLHFVWLSFVFVRHDDLGEALRVIAVIFSGW